MKERNEHQMFIDMTMGKPLRCSKCGSTNAIKPINERSVVVRCGDCGHTKLTPEAEARQRGEDPFKAWTAGTADIDPKF